MNYKGVLTSSCFISEIQEYLNPEEGASCVLAASQKCSSSSASVTFKSVPYYPSVRISMGDRVCAQS